VQTQRKQEHSILHFFAIGNSNREAARWKTGQANMLIIANAIANGKSTEP